MKRFLAIYTGTPAAMASWNELPEHDRKEREAAGIKAWHAWADKHKASIVELGAPLGRTRKVSKEGTTDIRNNMTAFTVVQAETQEAAARLFENHPHFTIFPGDAIEVMECLPIPSM